MSDLEAMVEGLLESWRTNNRINLLLIEKISDEGMQCTLSKRGGRNITRQFTHLHNVRLWALENRRAKDLAEGLHKFETEEEPDKKTLAKHLTASAEAIEVFLRESALGEGNRRFFKKGVVAHLSYFIAHESHHRGNMLLTLKECGHALDKATRYGIWDWDRQ